jgi:hypothetical protein
MPPEIFAARVAALLAGINIQLDQTPDAEVLSDDEVYIGRALVDRAIISSKFHEFETALPPEPIVHMRNVAAVAVERAMDQQPQLTPERIRAIDRLASTSGFMP